MYQCICCVRAAPELCEVTVRTPFRTTDSVHPSQRRHTEHRSHDSEPSAPDLSSTLWGEQQLRPLWVCQRQLSSTSSSSSVCFDFYTWHLLSLVLCKLWHAGSLWNDSSAMTISVHSPGHGTASGAALYKHFMKNTFWRSQVTIVYTEAKMVRLAYDGIQ